LKRSRRNKRVHVVAKPLAHRPVQTNPISSARHFRSENVVVIPTPTEYPQQ
jgi:hypothetical protein